MSTWPRASPLARSLALLTHSYCLLRSRAPLRSLSHFGAHGKEVFVYELNASISYLFGPLCAVCEAMQMMSEARFHYNSSHSCWEYSKYRGEGEASGSDGRCEKQNGVAKKKYRESLHQMRPFLVCQFVFIYHLFIVIIFVFCSFFRNVVIFRSRCYIVEDSLYEYFSSENNFRHKGGRANERVSGKRDGRTDCKTDKRTILFASLAR